MSPPNLFGKDKAGPHRETGLKKNVNGTAG
jgi:hypothetical protein